MAACLLRYHSQYISSNAHVAQLVEATSSKLVKVTVQIRWWAPIEYQCARSLIGNGAELKIRFNASSNLAGHTNN